MGEEVTCGTHDNLRANGLLRRKAAEVKEKERQISSLPQGIVGQPDDKAVVGAPTEQVSCVMILEVICIHLKLAGLFIGGMPQCSCNN